MHTPNSIGSRNTGDNSTDGRLVAGKGLGLEKIEATRRADEAKEVGSDSYSWALVLAALLLSIVALGCVIGLLRHFDQRPIDEWPLALSLGTIVSILGGIARASLAFAIGAGMAQGKWNWFSGRTDSLIAFDRFDHASKGPWGCLRLLPTVARRGHWITLGAIGTILLLGYEPFLQAALNLQDRTVVLPSPAGEALRNGDMAVLGRTTKLDAGTYLDTGGFAGSGGIRFTGPDGVNRTVIVSLGFDVQPDPGMMAAVWLGLSPQATPKNLWPQFACSSGNCTWDAFPSLAVCSQCHDLTPQLVRFQGTLPNQTIDTSGWPDNATMPDITNTGFRANFAMVNDPHPYTKYTVAQNLAPGLNLSNYDGPTRCKPGSLGCPDTYLAGRIQTNPGQTIHFSDMQTLIMAFQYMAADASWPANKTLWEDTPVSAGECALYYCVNAYASKIERGELVETTVGTWTDKTPGSYSSLFDQDDMDVYTAFSNHTLDYTTAFGDFERSDLQLQIPPSAASAFSLSAEAASIKFNVSQGTIGTTITYLTQTMGGHVRDSTPEFVAFHYPSLGGWSSPSDLMTNLGAASKVSSGNSTSSQRIVTAFNHTAQAFTKWMRDRAFQDGGVNPEQSINGQQLLVGNVLRATVIFSTQWLFLVWPATTLLLAVVFVALSVWDTKAKGLPPWEGSSLVTLAFGLDEGDRAELRDALLKKDAQAAARGMQARFRKGGTQPGLVLSRAGATGREL
ncbi:hypothetical protein QBC39DRAFT_270071 [Podospora conica]|nr:hypothetical protein QBC39DRAFT_270071 [Schizothecium conicum]